MGKRIGALAACAALSVGLLVGCNHDKTIEAGPDAPRHPKGVDPAKVNPPGGDPGPASAGSADK